MARAKEHQPSPSENKCGPQHSGEHWTKRALEVAIFVAAAIAAFFTGRQAYLENKQLRVGRETLWVAQDQERRQLRAYIGITPGDVKDFGIRQQSVVFTRHNYGQTPAYNVGFTRMDADIVLRGAPVPVHSIGCGHPLTQQHTIFPTMPIKWEMDIWKNWPQNILDTVTANGSKDQGYVFVYYGTICYNDAFSNPHYTNFCFMYHGKSMKADDADACFGDNDSD